MKLPRTQTEEVLYCLIKNNGLTRRELLLDCGVLNAPECVRRLRGMGVDILTREVMRKNKFKRDVKYGTYYLKNVLRAVHQYNALFSEKK